MATKIELEQRIAGLLSQLDKQETRDKEWRVAYDDLQARYESLNAEYCKCVKACELHEETTKKVASLNSSLKYAQEGRTAAESQLEQVHLFIDNMPGGLPRRVEGAYQDTPVFTRLAVMLATKGNL